MKMAYKINGPVYIRLAMNKEKEFFTDDYQLPYGETEILKDGFQTAIFTTGSILQEVMEAAECLEKGGVSTAVINVPILKPFNRDDVMKQAEKVKLICTVEEHNIVGGLGSMIADALAETNLMVKTLRIGLNDSFSVGYGTLPQIRKENGLDAETIVRRIIQTIHE